MSATSPSLRSHTPKGTRARDKIVHAAEKLFAAAGFHGASMRDVAEATELPLASVVYHFAKKEQLYGAVLDAIGAELGGRIDRALDDADRGWAAQLDEVVRALVGWTEAHPGRVKLLLRELLDNPERLKRAGKLPVAPVLVRLTELVRAGTAAGAFRRVVPETSVLHLVGAISYVVAAKPTVRRIVGAARERQMASSYEREAIAFARRMFLALDPEVAIHGSEDTGHVGEARARARRGANDRLGRRTDDDRRRVVPR